MAKYEITVNAEKQIVEASPDMPLLWVLRDKLKLTGTKYGCGIAQCGACTVHVEGVPVRSCMLPISAVSGSVTTIEGLAERRQPASFTNCLDRSRCSAMWLLSVRSDHERRSVIRE